MDTVLSCPVLNKIGSTVPCGRPCLSTEALWDHLLTHPIRNLLRTCKSLNRPIESETDCTKPELADQIIVAVEPEGE